MPGTRARFPHTVVLVAAVALGLVVAAMEAPRAGQRRQGTPVQTDHVGSEVAAPGVRGMPWERTHDGVTEPPTVAPPQPIEISRLVARDVWCGEPTDPVERLRSTERRLQVWSDGSAFVRDEGGELRRLRLPPELVDDIGGHQAAVSHLPAGRVLPAQPVTGSCDVRIDGLIAAGLGEGSGLYPPELEALDQLLRHVEVRTSTQGTIREDDRGALTWDYWPWWWEPDADHSVCDLPDADVRPALTESQTPDVDGDGLGDRVLRDTADGNVIVVCTAAGQADAGSFSGMGEYGGVFRAAATDDLLFLGGTAVSWGGGTVYRWWDGALEMVRDEAGNPFDVRDGYLSFAHPGGEEAPIATEIAAWGCVVGADGLADLVLATAARAPDPNAPFEVTRRGFRLDGPVAVLIWQEQDTRIIDVDGEWLSGLVMGEVRCGR